VLCQTPSTFQVEDEMKELLLDLITSYENRISTVEELVITAYQATAASEQSFGDLDKERERLKAGLQQILAKNCSLRKKDFNNLMERLLSDSEGKRKEIEEEQKRVREELKEYLDRQKELATSLRERLVQFTLGKADKDGLETIVNDLKATFQNKGEEVFSLLRNFQWHLEVFQREQEEINHKLQRLVDRGKSLRIEDLRQLEAAKAREDRKAERELRREDVERLLAHFRQERQRSSHQSAVILRERSNRRISSHRDSSPSAQNDTGNR